MLKSFSGSFHPEVIQVDTMDPKHWLRAVILIGLAYALIGVLFALPTTYVKAWRLAAWAVSAVLYVAHIAYETVRLGDSPRSTATHTALAAALGAFLLAVAAIVHSLFVQADNLHLLLLALVLWPVITAVPAFLIAFLAAAVLARLRTRT
jgi:hypothetical protein